MKLQQLRFLCEVANQGLNLSKAAEMLHTSQPGISKQIRLLENELEVDIFVRNGKRVVRVTPPGRAILEIAERMLRDAKNLTFYRMLPKGKINFATGQSDPDSGTGYLGGGRHCDRHRGDRVV